MDFIFSCLLPIIQWMTAIEFFFIACKEGEARSIVSNTGRPIRMVALYTGHHLNDPADKANFDNREEPWEVIAHEGWTHTDGTPRTYKPQSGFRGRLAREGIFFVASIVHKSYKYNFRWQEPAQNAAGELILPLRHLSVRSIFLREFVYGFVLPDAETVAETIADADGDKSKDTTASIPLSATFFTTIKVTNPYTSLHGVDSWMTQTGETLFAAVRHLIGQGKFYDIVAGKVDLVDSSGNPVSGAGSFSDILSALTRSVPGRDSGLKKITGITVTGALLRDISPTNESDRQAIETAYRANQQAREIEIVSEAEAKKVERMGAAKAKAVKDLGEALKEYTEVHSIELVKALPAGLQMLGEGGLATLALGPK